MSILTTERLRLEPCTDIHIEELDKLNSDIEVMRYITGVPITLEETKAHIEFVKGLWKNLGYSSWSIIEIATGQLVGTGSVHHLEYNLENPIEIGWRLLPSQWGKGFASEAAQRMMQFAFENVGIKTLHAVCHQENLNSVKVMRRLGMEYYGIEHWYNLDTFVFKITKEQFFKNREAALAGAETAGSLVG